jgi:hypothetical protein
MAQHAPPLAAAARALPMARHARRPCSSMSTLAALARPPFHPRLDAQMCHSDLHKMLNDWAESTYDPALVPGHEVVGIVKAVGPKGAWRWRAHAATPGFRHTDAAPGGRQPSRRAAAAALTPTHPAPPPVLWLAAVTTVKVGDRVGYGPQRDCCHACHWCTTGADNCCPDFKGLYDPAFGGYATSITVPEHFTFTIPDAIPSEVAGPLMCAGITTYAPLAKYVKAGDKVGVIGIGGLGHMGLQYAAAMGAQVWAISTSSAKEAEARKFGAQHFLVSKVRGRGRGREGRERQGRGAGRAAAPTACGAHAGAVSERWGAAGVGSSGLPRPRSLPFTKRVFTPRDPTTRTHTPHARPTLVCALCRTRPP